MSGNICRCGAYSNIQEAIAEVAGVKAMKAFTYESAARPPRPRPRRPRTKGAKFIAGGTNLLDLMKLQIETPTTSSTSTTSASTRSSRRRKAD